MKIKKWTSIDDCPKGKKFLAILQLGYLIRISFVYVHTDNHFLAWKDLRTSNGRGIGNWKCIFYIK